jgi:hypothetical protein
LCIGQNRTAGASPSPSTPISDMIAHHWWPDVDLCAIEMDKV